MQRGLRHAGETAVASGIAGAAVASASRGWGVSGPAVPWAASTCEPPDLPFARRKSSVIIYYQQSAEYIEFPIAKLAAGCYDALAKL